MKNYHFNFVMFADDDTNIGSTVKAFEAENSEDARHLAMEYCKHLFAREGAKRIEVAGLIVESVEVVDRDD